MGSITIRLPDEEIELLKEYCEQTGRTQSDVLRGLIRGLEKRIRTVKPEDINPLSLPSVPFKLKLELPETPGVYFVISATDEILYIGRAKDLRRRWGDTREIDFDTSTARIAWLELKSSKIQEFEKRCIRLHNPPLNKRSW